MIDRVDRTSVSTRRRRVRTAILALAVASAGALIAAKPAEAGEYVATQCSSIHAGADARWERTSDDYQGRRRCASGGGLQVYHDGGATHPGRYGAWTWRAPAGSVFTSLQANASLSNHAGHHGELRATRSDGAEISFGSEHDDFRIHRRDGEFARFSALLRCVSADGCERADEDRAHAYAKGVFLRVADRSTPTLSLTGGSLLANPVVRGARTLAFAASDRGGGIRRVSVSANGTDLASDIRNCALSGGFATALAPCPPATAGSWTVNTDDEALSTGPNTIAACASDLALDGSANRDCIQRRVWVDNACPASASAVDGAQLSARFVGGRPTTTVRSDRRATVGGRITDGSGHAVGDAPVCALTRVQRNGSPVVVAATAGADGEGRYRLRLPRGASREVFVHHVNGTDVIARHGLELRSRARPTLRVRPRTEARNGDRLRFAGNLGGPSCSGRIVKIQAKVAEERWQVFRTDHTNRRCRFRARYRLRATTGPATYRFRALVPPQAGYPYERGHSKVRSVSTLAAS